MPTTSGSSPRCVASARADDPSALREVARQFESIFTKMMLDSMRKASFGDPMFGSDQGDMYQDMMDDQLAIEMSQGKGLGLADMLIRQLSHGGEHGVRRGRQRRARSVRCRRSSNSSRRYCRRPGRGPRARRGSARASSRRRRSRPAGAPRNPPTLAAAVTTLRHQGRRALAGRGASRPSTHGIRRGVAGDRNRAIPRLRRRSRTASTDYVLSYEITRVTRPRSTPAATCALSRPRCNAADTPRIPDYANKLVAVAERARACGGRLPRSSSQVDAPGR